MRIQKVVRSLDRGKSSVTYDHWVALEWSLETMAIGHMGRQDAHSRVFERSMDLRDLKGYLGSLKGRIILTLEESATSHWLYLEFLEYVERIVICDPFHNKLLCHGPVKIAATAVDARRFPSAGRYLSYCGLVTNEKLSGGRSDGWRRPRYSRVLKSVYRTAAMVALQGANSIRDYYDHLLSGGVAQRNARHAVARRIARISYGMLKSGTRYEPYRWSKGAQEVA